VKAVLLRETGGPERLELADVEDPEPGEGQALLRVRAAGINFADVLIRQGRYPQAPPLPMVPGSEAAGEVDGRRVMALLPAGGGYAEYVAVDEGWLVPLPDGGSFAEGASFLMTFLTAWLPLRQLEPGSTVLVHAAAGGVGSAAVLVARHLGARVIATASSEEKRRLALELGADEAYGYDDFAAAVKPDVVFDTVGGPVFTASLSTLRPMGTIVAVGFAGGMWEHVDPALLVGRNMAVRGFYLGRLMGLRPDLVREAAAELRELWQAGAIRPVVGAEYALAEA
jgi:NADPH:quinone reductase